MTEDFFQPVENPRMKNYNGEAIFQAYMRAKRAGQSTTPFRFTDGNTYYFNVIWDGESFTRNSFDPEPLTESAPP